MMNSIASFMKVRMAIAQAELTPAFRYTVISDINQSLSTVQVVEFVHAVCLSSQVRRPSSFVPHDSHTHYRILLDTRFYGCCTL